MRYVKRDGDENITGHSAWPKFEGQEALPDDHPEIVAFNDRPLPEPPSAREIIEAVDQVAKNIPLTAAKRNKITALMTRISGA